MKQKQNDKVHISKKTRHQNVTSFSPGKKNIVKKQNKKQTLLKNGLCWGKGNFAQSIHCTTVHKQMQHFTHVPKNMLQFSGGLRVKKGRDSQLQYIKHSYGLLCLMSACF